MPYRTDIAYLYDGSFLGLMCCVFTSYERREYPAAVLSYDEPQGVLYEVREIETDPVRGERVLRSIPEKMGEEAMSLVEQNFYSAAPDKGLHILQFLRLGYGVGPKVVRMLTDSRVEAMWKGARTVGNEAHYYQEFIRFSAYNGVLIATIEPKNFVLPLIRDHFCDRLNAETFMVYDLTHRHALIYSAGRAEIVELEDLELPPSSEDERYYRALWRRFYDTIAIEERTNHPCRMNMMPKRFWKHMTEFHTEDYPETMAMPDGVAKRMEAGHEQSGITGFSEQPGPKQQRGLDARPQGGVQRG